QNARINVLSLQGVRVLRPEAATLAGKHFSKDVGGLVMASLQEESHGQIAERRECIAIFRKTKAGSAIDYVPVRALGPSPVAARLKNSGQVAERNKRGGVVGPKSAFAVAETLAVNPFGVGQFVLVHQGCAISIHRIERIRMLAAKDFDASLPGFMA